MLYKCECCGNYTLLGKSSGMDNICPVCFWQDDYVQLHDHDFSGGANKVSLNQARKNFIEFGACERELRKYVREARESELPWNN